MKIILGILEVPDHLLCCAHSKHLRIISSQFSFYAKSLLFDYWHCTCCYHSAVSVMPLPKNRFACPGHFPGSHLNFISKRTCLDPFISPCTWEEKVIFPRGNWWKSFPGWMYGLLFQAQHLWNSLLCYLLNCCTKSNVWFVWCSPFFIYC